MLSLGWTFYEFSKYLTFPLASRPAKSFHSNASRGHWEEELININLKRIWTLRLTHCLEQEQICDKIPPKSVTLIFNKFSLSSAQVQILDRAQIRKLWRAGFGSALAIEVTYLGESDPELAERTYQCLWCRNVILWTHSEHVVVMDF